MTLREIFDLSNYTQWFGSFVILMLVLNSYKILPLTIRIIGLMGLVSVVFQLLQTINTYFFRSQHLNTIGDCYVFLETLIFLAYYYILFKDGRILRLALLFSALLSISIYAMVILADANYPWYAVLSTIRSVLLIVFSVITFFKLIKDLPNDNLLSLPTFWINSGILFLYSCTFMLALSMDYIARVLRDDFGAFWAFKNFLRAGFCVVICIGIWKARQQALSPQSKKTIS